jgi:hypothetical protein
MLRYQITLVAWDVGGAGAGSIPPEPNGGYVRQRGIRATHITHAQQLADQLVRRFVQRRPDWTACAIFAATFEQAPPYAIARPLLP